MSAKTSSTPRGVGRPRVSDAERRVSYGVSLPRRLWDRIDRLCAERHVSRGELVEQWVLLITEGRAP